MRWIVVAGTPRWRSTLAALLVGASTASVRRVRVRRLSKSEEIVSTPAATSPRTRSASSMVFPEPALPITASVGCARPPSGSSAASARSTPAACSTATMRSRARA